MTRSLTKTILIALIVVFLGISIFVSFRYISYFDLKEIKTVFDGKVSGISDDAKKLIVELNGKNLFEISKKDVKESLLATDCVTEVKIKKNYPSEISITIVYRDFGSRLLVSDSNANRYYLADKSGITEVSDEIFDLYSPLEIVYITEDYFSYIQKWGIDNGFVQMMELVSDVSQNNLITLIKYDNNKGNEFGRLVLYMQSYNVQLNVREPVNCETLESAIEMIMLECQNGNQVEVYDLYAGGLFGRT